MDEGRISVKEDRKSITVCPKCGADICDENQLIINQKFSTIYTGLMTNKGIKEYDDYNDVDVDEDGEPEIVGCQGCI